MLILLFTTPTERPAYFGMLGATFGLGTVLVSLFALAGGLQNLYAYSLGPIVGGTFADSSATWRWAFYINLIIGAIFAPMYFLYLPSRDPRPGASFISRVREIDWVGTILQVGAFTSGIMALSFGGVVFIWSSGQIIGLLVFPASSSFSCAYNNPSSYLPQENNESSQRNTSNRKKWSSSSARSPPRAQIHSLPSTFSPSTSNSCRVTTLLPQASVFYHTSSLSSA